MKEKIEKLKETVRKAMGSHCLGIVDQDPNYDRCRTLSVRDVVRRRVNVGDVVLHKPGYKVGRNQYLCRDVDRKRMLKRVKEAGLMARPAAGVGYDYNFKGYIYTVDWRN